MKDTPADVAGLKISDIVIKIKGEQIKNSNHLRNEIANAGAGSDIELIVISDSSKRKFLIRLDERPKQLGRVDEIEEIEMGS